MNILNTLVPFLQRILMLSLSLCLTFISSVAHAEDIEIYSRSFDAASALSDSPAALNPNILFILDTSGRMSLLAPVRSGDGYDATIDYGNDGDAPDDNLIYIYQTNLTLSGVTITQSQNVCQAYRDNLAANPNSPIFTDRIEQWRLVSNSGGGRYGWRSDGLRQLFGSNEVLECEDDSGIHGLTASSTDLFARNPDNRFTNQASATPRYEDSVNDRRNPYNASFVLLPGNYHDFLESLPDGLAIGTDETACSGQSDGAEVIIGGNVFTCRPRLAIMQEALNNVLATREDINIGLMRFNMNMNSSNSGGTVIRAIENINEPTVRETFLDTVNDLTASDFTPPSESMFEAHQYYAGGNVVFGNDGVGTDPDALETNNSYEPPIISECQDNNIVMLTDIENVDSDMFVAPAVTVNAFNRLQNREDLYFLVFNPDESSRWSGNVKRYTVNADAEIIDANGNNAVSPTTGFFTNEAQSIWSELPDGAVVEDGGVAEQLSTNRRLFASLDTDTNVVSALSNQAGIEQSVDQFLDLTNALDIGQIGADEGVTPDAIAENREDIARWTLGTDIDNERQQGNTAPNNYLGETLHGSPFVLSYGTSIDDPQDIVFYTTNQGILHAVNAQAMNGLEEGSELWAYIPDPDLLENLGGYYNRSGEDHIYGLDATLAFDFERNPVTNEVDNALLYFGQRRGGSKYFAVDVTNADQTTGQIEKVFSIEGGEDEFVNMGQSWATPVATQIRFCEDGQTIEADCELRDVLIISGGYDIAYDDEDANLSDLVGTVDGNSIYIVDAQAPEDGEEDTRGQLLFSIGSEAVDERRDLVIPEMLHSIPSEPTVIDVNGDGAADLMFAIDLAGQVFRIDFEFGPDDANGNGISAVDNTSSVAGGLIADLSESGVNRRFYNPLDVTLLPSQFDADDNSTLINTRYALVTGSGYRAHPTVLEPFDNRYYVVFDDNILVPEIDLKTGSPNYLYGQIGEGVDAVDALIDMDTSTTLRIVDEINPIDVLEEHENGYFVSLGSGGEKVLAPTLISEFRAIAVSYLPDGAVVAGDDLVAGAGLGDGPETDTPVDAEVQSGTGSESENCFGGIGNSRAVELDLLTGIPEFTALERPGLSPQPVILQILDVNTVSGEEVLRPIVVIGTESFEGSEFGLDGQDLGRAVKRAWWEEQRGSGNTIGTN